MADSNLKPIETKEQKEKREHRQRLFIGLFVSFIMLFSSVGYMIGNHSSSKNSAGNESVRQYNNYTFTKISQVWVTNASIEGNNIQVVSSDFPGDLENLSTSGKPFLSDFSGKNLYFLANSAAERQAASVFYSYLGNIANRMQFACSESEANDSFCADNNLPIKGCGDVSKSTAIISIEEDVNSTAASIGSQDSCLTIAGNSTGLIKAAEKSIFLIFGIMKS